VESLLKTAREQSATRAATWRANCRTETQVIRTIANLMFPGLLDGPVVQLELVLVLAALALGLTRPPFKAMDRLLQRCSKHPAAAFTSCALLALALHLMVAP